MAGGGAGRAAEALSDQQGGRMGLLSQGFGKGRELTDQRVTANLAFVLLSQPVLCRPAAGSRRTQCLRQPGESLRAQPGPDRADRRGFSLELSTGETSMVVLMPVVVPNGEADEGAQFSLSSFEYDRELPPHHAHLVVTFQAPSSLRPLERLSHFTSLIAAIAKCSPSSGSTGAGLGPRMTPTLSVRRHSGRDIACHALVRSKRRQRKRRATQFAQFGHRST